MRAPAVVPFLLAALAAFTLPQAARANAPYPGPGAADRDAPRLVKGAVMVKFAPSGAAGAAAARIRGGVVETGHSGVDATLRRGRASAMARAIRDLADAGTASSLGLDRWYRVTIPADIEPVAYAAELARQPGVEWAEPVFAIIPTVVPNDPQYAQNWGHHNTAQMKAWQAGTGQHTGAFVGTVGYDTGMESAWGHPTAYGSTSVKIAILDDGVDVDHPDLRIGTGYDFVDGDSNPDAPVGANHGTACAGIAAAVANNALGVIGAAGGVTIMPLRTATNLDVANGLTYAANNGAAVASMSFYFGVGFNFDKLVSDAADYAYANGVVMLAATGNDDVNFVGFPARHPKVIAVGASSPCGQRKRGSGSAAGTSCDGETWWGSNWGAGTANDSAAVDVVAPTILPTTDQVGANGYNATDYVADFNGTSCATPYAAGVAALIKAQYPTATPAQIRTLLVNTARDVADAEAAAGWDAFTGYGLVQAGKALDLPDYLPFQPGGWGDNIVPRATNDATSTSVPLPTVLNGGATSYFNGALINAGPGIGPFSGGMSWRVDGVDVAGFGIGPWPAGVYGWANNIGVVVAGGRHTVENAIDPSGAVPEVSESNNTYARQWVWQPPLLADGSISVLAAPPNRNAGRSAILAGQPNFDNLAAVRFAEVDSAWHVVAMHANDLTSDYDVRLYNASTGALNGLDNSWLTSSAYVAGYTDAVLVNGHAVPGQSYDVGVLNYSGSTAGYRLEHRTGAPASIGTNVTGLPLASQQMIALHDLNVLAGQTGRVLIELTVHGTTQPVTLALYDAAFTRGPIISSSFNAVTDGSGKASLDVTLASVAHYGVAVYRNTNSGTGALTYDLRIRPTPADLAAYTHAGWIAPSGPGGAQFDPVVVPTQLDGDQATTYYHYDYKNLGPNPASGFQVRELIDGVSVLDWTPGGTLNPGSEAIWNTGLRLLTGGRHTMGFRTNFTNSFDELILGNNNHASQWVWSPVPLALGATAARSAPPDRAGGLDDVPGMTWDNVDGVRTPAFTPSGLNGYWGATAVMPGPGSDVDLSWYTTSSGPDSGYRVPLKTSADGASQTEVMVVDINGAQTYDVGVVRAGGSVLPYRVQAVASVFAGYDPALIGPQMVPAGELMRLFEFARSTSEPLQVLLENLSGNADLAFAIFQWGGSAVPRTKFETLPGGYADANGPGGSEGIVCNQDLNGQFVCVAVWKKQASELGKAATFDLRLGTPGNVDAPDPGSLPSTLSLAPIPSNPVRGEAKLFFDLPEAGSAKVEVFDLQGHRVRTLASGAYGAGRHPVAWSGLDNEGQRVGNGVYFVRFEAGGFTQTRRLVLVR